MKKITILFASSILLFSSCGKDGLDGEYYISINDVACIQSYTDDNSCVPYGMSYYYTYGPCSNDGSKAYTFYYCSGGGWSGHYSVGINKGKTKKTFKDGENGADRYYTLNLTGTGLSTSYRGSVENQNNEYSHKDFFNEFDGENQTIDKYVDMGNGYSMHITGRKIKAGEVVITNPKYLKK